jgi:hypothetical protein
MVTCGPLGIPCLPVNGSGKGRLILGLREVFV